MTLMDLSSVSKRALEGNVAVNPVKPKYSLFNFQMLLQASVITGFSKVSYIVVSFLWKCCNVATLALVGSSISVSVTHIV